jgi:membrane-bound ClpP family serine protease
MTSTAAIILVTCTLVAAGMLAAISRHKKSGTGNVKLIGATGLVDTKLDPHGTVLIHGDLWRACSNDGSAIATRSKVSVVGMRDHLLLVRLQDQ